MRLEAAQKPENTNDSEKKEFSREETGGISTQQFEDNRKESGLIQKMQNLGDNSPKSQELAQLKALADSNSESENSFIQKKANDTGLPDNLKSGVENLSGYSMDNVKVHYNSDKPAQLEAHAYAQGTDIHVAPGQEQHLPHEAWHVVQQKQGRVNATKQLKGAVAVNDDAGLENEADVMGAKALQSGGQLDSELEQGAESATAQLRVINMGGHGNLEIGNFAQGLGPDAPGYGGVTGLHSDNVATSMNMLVTPNHPEGSSPKDQDVLFSQLPTIGKYKLPANLNKPKDGNTIYIKGHLLNDNLGGPGVADNLYPITHQANVDHDNLVEEPIKEWVNKHGGIVHYQVNVNPGGGGITNVKDEDGNKLKYVDAQFQINVNAFTKAGPQVVANNKIINSTWGNTGNGGKINFAGVPEPAPAFAIDKVNLPPRTQIKKEWDETYFQIAVHLAETTGVKLGVWLKKNINGVGPASVKLLEDKIDYNTLNKSGKGTLTKARGLLKDFIEEKYNHYLRVAPDEEEDTDAGNISPTDAIMPSIAVDLNKVKTVIDELDLLISKIKGLSLGSDDGTPSSSDDGGGGYQSPFYARGAYGKEVSSPPRGVPDDALQGEDFIQFRDFYPKDSTNVNETCWNYVYAVSPRVNPMMLQAFLEHAQKTVNISMVSPSFNLQWWRHFTMNVNTTALYYGANFPEGVFKTSFN